MVVLYRAVKMDCHTSTEKRSYSEFGKINAAFSFTNFYYPAKKSVRVAKKKQLI